MIAATSFCILMLFGAGIGCNDDARGKGAVVDRTCDMGKVELPAEWRAQCVKDKKLRTDVDAKTRKACRTLLDNERILKQRKCI